MQPLTGHRDLTAPGCIVVGGVVGETLRQDTQPLRNIPRQGDLRRGRQFPAHETVEVLFTALQIGKTAISFQRERLLKRSNPHQKSFQSLAVQTRCHLEGGVSGWLGHQWVWTSRTRARCCQCRSFRSQLPSSRR